MVFLDDTAAPTTAVYRSLTTLDVAWLRHRIATRCFEVATTPLVKKVLKDSAPSADVSQKAKDAGMSEWHCLALPEKQVDGDETRVLKHRKYLPAAGIWVMDDIRRLLQRFASAPDATSRINVADRNQIQDALKSIGSVVNDLRHDQHVSARQIHSVMSDMAYVLGSVTVAEDVSETLLAAANQIRGAMEATLVLPRQGSQLQPPRVDHHPTFGSGSTATTHFTERQWVIVHLKTWLAGAAEAAPSTGALLTAEPGFGKSAIAVWLIRSSSSGTDTFVLGNNVVLVAHFVCCAQSGRGLRAGDFVVALLEQLQMSLTQQFGDLCKDRNALHRATVGHCASQDVACWCC